MELPLPSSILSPESFPSPTPVNEEEQVSMGSSREEISSGSSKNKECDEGDTNDDGKDAIENCDDKVEEPKVGMEFNTANEAYMYYARFAKEKGFVVAKRHSKKGKDGIVTQVAFQCTRGGKPRIRTSNPVRLRPQTKIGCPARLHGCLSPDGKCILTVVVLEHNHEQSLGKSRFFKRNRIINEHVKKRIILNDKAGIHMYKTYESLQIKAGGHDKLPFTEKDCRNFLEKARRLRLGEGDAEAMHSYFMRMKADNSGFFSAYDLNEKGRLRNVFWADARSRAACKEFGDVVTFDTTYLLNKYDMPFAPFVGVNHHGQSILLGCGLISHEDTASFVWLFQAWMTCMGAPPKAIITDQCMAMKNAIEIVFPNTRHRWCIWHILKKLPEKFSGYKEYDRISWRMRNVVWDSLTIEEFEVAWDAFIKHFKLQSNPWLNAMYLERKRWVPAFVKDEFWAGMSSTQRSESMNAYFDGYVNSKTTLKQFVEQYENALAKKVEGEKEEDMKSWYSYIPCITEDELEKQFQSVYTPAKVREFQKEFIGKCVCALTQTIVGDVFSEYEVIENATFGEGEEKIKKRVPFTVIFNGTTNEATCKCRLFECRGMLCKHQLMVFHQRGVERVPEKYVLRRWCKNVKRGHTKIRMNYDNSSRTIEARRHDNICSLYDEIADLAEDSQEKCDEVMKMGRELKRKWIEESVVCGSNMVADTLNESCSIGDERMASKQSTTILDPEAMRRKERPPSKRKQGIVEKAVKKKRESKKKTSLKAKAKEGDEIAVGNVVGTQENVGHTFGTQQSGVHSYPGYMGEQMWANVMPNYMAHGGTGFMQNFSSSQSYMQSLPSSQVWTGQGQGLGGRPHHVNSDN